MPHRRTIAVFPGQFDPITLGHVDVIRRGVQMFDEVIVGVGINPEKRELFTLKERVAMIREILSDIPGARVEQYVGLTVDFTKRMKATVLLRGIRDASDLRYEFHMAQVNRAVGNVETCFMMTGAQYALMTSSLIRQIMSLGGNVKLLDEMLPPIVIDRLAVKQRAGKMENLTEGDAPAT